MLIESVGGNKEASRLAGIRSRGLIILAYVFSALCAGIAGLMISSIVSGADGNNAGLWIELDAILAVVIGGTALAGGRFFLAGTIIGAVLIQTLITTIYSIGIPPETNLLFKALVVTLVCLIQSPAFREKVFRLRREAADARERGRPAETNRRRRPHDVHHRRPSAGRASRRGSRRSTCPILMTLALLVTMFTVGSSATRASQRVRSSSTSSSTTRSCSSSRSG